VNPTTRATLEFCSRYLQTTPALLREQLLEKAVQELHKHILAGVVIPGPIQRSTSRGKRT
jgi:hypothetical protein